jgi:hypothetical protein
MWRSNPVCLGGLVATILLGLSPAPRASAQGLQSTLRAGARVFGAVGPGVAALKRDSAGRYYILARPATTISIYDAAGSLVGQIPNAHSGEVTIRYAVDIDLDSTDRLFVVDRGANAIKIFAPDGSPVATIPVNAPTSVVALSGGQFAVTTLLSKRLVQIMDENGNVVRTFGDPADVAPTSPAETEDAFAPNTRRQPALVDRGRIIGDSAGNIYFSYSSLPDPTLQRFDRYGYSGYESVVPQEAFGAQQRESGRIEVGYSMSALGWPTSFSAWTDLHSLSSLSMSDRARRGLRAASASSPGSSWSSPTDAPRGNVAAQGNVLDFTAGASSDTLDSGDNYTASVTSSDSNDPDSELTMMPGMFGMGIGGFFHGPMPDLFDHPSGGAGPGPDASSHPDFGGDHPAGGPGHDGFHFHPGFDEYRARAAVRVRLDHPPPGAGGKPSISAVGVDPVSHEVWAAIGDTLVHFDSGGAREDMYYLVLTDDTSLKPSSILVEPDRLLVAADPWGIYEFPRPDKPSAAPAANSAPVAAPASDAMVPEQVAPAPNSHRQPLSPAPTSAPQP